MRVAVLGSGLAGLTAAGLLARKGTSSQPLRATPRDRGSHLERREGRVPLGPGSDADAGSGARGAGAFGSRRAGDLRAGGGDPGLPWERLSRLRHPPTRRLLRSLLATRVLQRDLSRGRRRPRPLLRSLRPGPRPYRTDNQSALAVRLQLLLRTPRIRRFKSWSAEQFLDAFFSSPKLKAVFSHILADYSTYPRDFPGLIIPIINPEAAYDERVPEEYGGQTRRCSWTFIRNGTRAMVDAIAGAVTGYGGEIHLETEVTQVLVKDGRVTGIELNGEQRQQVDAVVASGGARSSSAS